MLQYKRLDGESDEALIYRVCRDKDSIGTWQMVADILNPLLGTDYGESTFRKKYAAFQQMFEANRNLFVDDKEQLARLREEEKLLAIEKVKFRDERNAWAAQNRIQARAEAKLDNIEDALRDFGRIYFPEHPSPAVTQSDDGRSILIMLSDLHIGASFDNFWGKFNTDVARERLGELFEEVKDIARRHKGQECFVALLGDNISGNIHESIRVTNRENVIEQIKRCAELVTSFCYELTKVFSMVTLVSVDGNHSRIAKEEESVHDERLDSMIPFCVNMALEHVKNFYYCEEANIDNGIALFPIRDKYYVAVHGDYDSYSKDGLQSLVTMIRAIPYAVLLGHRHYCAVTEVNGIKMVQGGSLAGSGDDFTIKRRLCGKASQMVCVCSDSGIEAYYPVELD